MPEVIRRGRVEADPWTFLDLEPGEGEAALPTGPLAVPLATWLARKAGLLTRHPRVGVWLAPDDDPELLRADLPVLTLVAIRFPRFTDGRGYSNAVLLRRAGYAGELRAIGDVGRDQLFYLSRVGFDAFSPKPGLDPHAALAAFGDFSVRYQASVDGAPLFRRRAGGKVPVPLQDEARVPHG